MDTTVNLCAAGLAYLGDAVFELLVRDMLVKTGEQSVGNYTERAKDFVSAKAQSLFYHKLYDALSEEEQAILKRGRNLHPAARAKNASVSAYRHATGVETLFGYLYCKGRCERLAELFKLCGEETEREQPNA